MQQKAAWVEPPKEGVGWGSLNKWGSTKREINQNKTPRSRTCCDGNVNLALINEELSWFEQPPGGRSRLFRPTECSQFRKWSAMEAAECDGGVAWGVGARMFTSSAARRLWWNLMEGCVRRGDGAVAWQQRADLRVWPRAQTYTQAPYERVTQSSTHPRGRQEEGKRGSKG